MAKYEVWIDEWRPESLNVLLKAHWAERKRMKDEDKMFVKAYCLRHKVPPATGKRRVSIHITLTGRMKQFDDDNMRKSLHDALVACGMLTDDNRAGVEQGEITYSRSPDWGTKITLEDII